MSVQTHLQDTASKAVLSSTENSSIATSITTLSSRLTSWFGSDVKEKSQFGSSTRGTILPRSIDGNSDIDYMIVFADSQYKPQTYIDKLKRFAEKKYSSSEIAQSHPTVVLNLNHIKLDLVPAIAPSYAGYQIPAPASGYLDWLNTYPNAFNKELTDANKRHGNHIKPLVRIVKYWNAQNSYLFDSFGLEQHLVSTTSWHASFKEYVYSAFDNLNVPWDAAQWRKDKVSRAKQIVNNTRQHERDDMPYSAESEIKKLIPPIT